MSRFTYLPEHWLPRGEAAAYEDRRRVVIFGGIPGEAAHVEVLHRGGNQDAVRFVAPAGPPHPLRVEPVCHRYTLCGGCPLMHLNPEGQERARLALVRHAFVDEGLEEHVPSRIVPSPDGDQNYRHHVKLVVGRSEQGSVRLGTYSRNSHLVVTIPECNVATPVLRHAMGVAAHHIHMLKIWPWEPERGILRHVLLRQSRATGEVLVTLVAGRDHRILRELAEGIATQVSAVASVHLHLNDDPGNAILRIDPESERPPFLCLRGKETIEEELAGVRLMVGPGDFFQANPGTADLLVRDALAAVADLSDRPAVDLYCGVGAFALPLAQQHGFALGVELGAGAVARAEANARRLHLPAEFSAGPVAELLPAVARRVAGRGPVVLVDPARHGLEPEVARGILALEPSRLLYVSCNPRALAIDLRRFLGEGWRIRRLRAYDMFPQTSHVELLAELEPPVVPTVEGRAPQRRIARRS